MPTLTIDQLIRPPTTVDEAVNLLLTLLDDKELNQIASMLKDDLIDLHFSTGMYIRNVLQLHDRKNPLASLGHPDDLSLQLLDALWDRLNFLKSQ